jgi:hypothetical protein
MKSLLLKWAEEPSGAAELLIECQHVGSCAVGNKEDGAFRMW